MQTTFEAFPWRMVLISNAVALAIYALGCSILVREGVLWAIGYAAYCCWIEWRVLSRSCRSCYYYGKRCAFGKGLVCSWFLIRKPSRNFALKPVTWLDIVPDFLVSLIPASAGIMQILHEFSWEILLETVSLIALGSAGTAFVRSSIACKYCIQRTLGCPAEQLFRRAK